jgi:hypothetical protein
MSVNITFAYTDINNEEQAIKIQVTCRDSEVYNLTSNDLPAEGSAHWPENNAFTYTFMGWSRKQLISKGVLDNEKDYEEFVDADALVAVKGDRILYPVFKANRKDYEVRFINPTNNDELLYCYRVPYGSIAEYPYEDPEKFDTEYPHLYEFTGWHPVDLVVIGDSEYSAQFAFIDSDNDGLPGYTLTINDVEYTKNGSNEITITTYNNNFNSVINIPDILDSKYSVVGLGGFANHSELELINLPNTLKTLQANAFTWCSKLKEIKIPANVTTIPSNAFSWCGELSKVELPEGLTLLDSTCFAWCNSLKSIKLPNSLECIKTCAFQDCALTQVNIPPNITEIQNMAFGAYLYEPSLKKVMFNTTTAPTLGLPGNSTVFSKAGTKDEPLDIFAPWSKDDSKDAPWGANYAKITYSDGIVIYSKNEDGGYTVEYEAL